MHHIKNHSHQYTSHGNISQGLPLKWTMHPTLAVPHLFNCKSHFNEPLTHHIIICKSCIDIPSSFLANLCTKKRNWCRVINPTTSLSLSMIFLTAYLPMLFKRLYKQCATQPVRCIWGYICSKNALLPRRYSHHSKDVAQHFRDHIIHYN